MNLALVAAALVGCSGGRNGEAVEACAQMLSQKLAGKTYSIDRSDMAANAIESPVDVIGIKSTAVFNKALTSEYSQNFEYRVRFDAQSPPSVIFLQINW